MSIPSSQLSSRQNAILDTVRKYPGRFSRSGLAKMLVGAKSWQEEGLPEYGRFANHTRKNITFDIDVLVQQGFLGLDGRNHLISVISSGAENGQ